MESIPYVDIISKDNKLILSSFISNKMKRFLNIHNNNPLANRVQANYQIGKFLHKTSQHQ